MGLSIVIPIKTNIPIMAHKFAEYIHWLLRDITVDRADIQLVIADESSPEIFPLIEHDIKGKKKAFHDVVHFAPDSKIRTGANDKMNGVRAAMDYIKHNNILLIDDHYRVDIPTIHKIEKYYEEYDCFKMMPCFHKFPLSVKCDLCGMFIVNILSKNKQFCGHYAFKKDLVDAYGFPSCDGLFDEFSMEYHFEKNGCKCGFVKDCFLNATQDISTKKFWEQRVRYAYENLAFPLRTVFYLSILPFCIVLGILNLAYLAAFLIALFPILMLLALVGQCIYAKDTVPKSTFLAAPIWFFHYPTSTWIALAFYISGGINFGNHKIKNPR